MGMEDLGVTLPATYLHASIIKGQQNGSSLIIDHFFLSENKR